MAGDPESYGYTADMYTGDGLRIATKGGQPNRGLGFGTGMSPSSRAPGDGSVSWIWTRRTRNPTEDMRAHGEPIQGPRAVARYVAGYDSSHKFSRRRSNSRSDLRFQELQDPVVHFGGFLQEQEMAGAFHPGGF